LEEADRVPFDEILGQDRAIRIVRSALATRSLPHAYLFYGAEGLGRFKTALALAMALLCKEVEGDSCGRCSACGRVNRENHPDVLVLRPQSRKGDRDWVEDPEQGVMRIHQIREMQRWIGVRSLEGGWKVGILDGAERLNPAASNALLKTLEEPPPGSILLLISTARNQLLPTIVSRCQAVYFSPMSRDVLEGLLSDNEEIPQTERSLLASLSAGSLGRALDMDRQWVVNERGQWIERLLEYMASGSEDSLMGFAEDLAQSPRMMDVLYLYASWFRDLRSGGPGQRFRAPGI
jgi:DNA polymerase-3 subunit delta'